jgi:hypothetical protein
MFGLKEWIHDYNYDMCRMMFYTVSGKKIVTNNICVRLVPYSTIDTQLSIFISEKIRIRIRSYPYSDSNPNKNIKTNIVSMTSIRIRSDYIPI